MERGRLDLSPSPEGRSCVPDDTTLEIELNSWTGQLFVADARLFGPAGRRLGRRLVEALCEHPGVRRAEVDSANAACRVDFDLACTSREVMADIFVDAVRASSARARRRWCVTRGPRWTSFVAYRHHGTVSSWETYADDPGHLRLVHRGPVGGRSVATDLADTIAGIDGVERCDISLWSRRIAVVLDREAGPSALRSMGLVEAAVEGRRPAAQPGPGATPTASPPTPVTGWKRPAFAVLGGGAFALALVGLLVPGVPTVPFLLASSYYLARSSPRLDERLRRTVLFGPILREWESQAALSTASKAKLAGLTITIVAVAVLLAPLTPITLGVILLISSLSVYGIARIPTLEADERAVIRTALPAPAG
jgi:uncharacterized membrane protein YbaN (DUF454 family)